MGQGHSMVGFVVIVALYATIGLLAAAGAIFISKKIPKPKAEQAFYGIFLIAIAAFYLAFVAYFGDEAAWQVEAAAVLVFAAIGLLGVRLPIALIVGYPLHGIWDFLHELQVHAGYSAFGPTRLTTIPLAYGIFCLAFDVCIGVYSHRRRAAWGGAGTAQPQ